MENAIFILRCFPLYLSARNSLLTLIPARSFLPNVLPKEKRKKSLLSAILILGIMHRK